MKSVLINEGELLNSYPFFSEDKKQFLLCQFKRSSNQRKTPINNEQKQGCQRFGHLKLKK